MRLVDANVFIHALVRPAAESGLREHSASRALFDRVSQGVESVATTEACLIEIFHVLTNKRRFGMAVPTVIPLLRSILLDRGIEVRRSSMSSEVLDVLHHHPRLDIEDGILVTHAISTGWPIVSYDRGFDRVPGITRVEPQPADI